MSRKLLINLHLYAAAFFTPVLLLMAITGGLYLFGEKGHFESETIYQGKIESFDFESKDLEGPVNKFIVEQKLDIQVDYLKTGKNVVYTRPFSKPHLIFQKQDNEVKVSIRTPNLTASLIELHKGHGPSIFKTFQKITAIGLLFVLLSGLYLGLSSPNLKNKTIVVSLSGLALFLIFAFV